MLLVTYSDAISIRLTDYDIKKSGCEKSLGVKFDNKLAF